MKGSNSLPIIDSPSPSMFVRAMFPHTVYGSECCDKKGMNSVMGVLKVIRLSPKVITHQAMELIKKFARTMWDLLLASMI